MKKLTHLLLGTFVLLCYGWFNRFPFVYPDTGDYISSGFLNYVPQSRPIFYGLFLRHLSLSETLWLPVFFQGLAIAWCFYLISRYLFSRKWHLPYWLMLCLTTAFTGVSVLSATLLPDVFTPVMIICSIGLLSQDLERTDKWITVALLFISLPMHNSHLPVIAAMIAFALVWTLIQKRRGDDAKSLWRLLLPSGTLLASIAFVLVVNFGISDKWKMSNGGSVFMVNRLIETGILQQFLNEECEASNYELCAYKGELKWGFLWDYDSPLYKMGGWDKVDEEYSRLWKDALSRPDYLKQFLIKSVEGSLAQWWMMDIDWVIKQKEGSSPHEAVKRFYPDYLITYESSGQNIGVWDFQNLNDFQRILMIPVFVLFFLLLIGRVKGIGKNQFFALWLLMLGLCANAFVCAAISNALSRYQYRVSFLVLAFVLLIFWDGKRFHLPQLTKD